MHLHARARQNCSANSKTLAVVNQLLKHKTHIKKPCEIYSKLYYVTHIQPAIKPRTPITDVNKKIHKMFEGETPEIWAEILRLSDQQCSDKKKKSKEEDICNELDDDEEDIKMDPSFLYG